MPDERLKLFFELKAKQMFCKLWLAKNRKIGYTSNEIYLLERVLNVESKLEEIEKELYNLLVDNAELFQNLDLNAEAMKPEYKVTYDRQKELSKEIFGKSYVIDDFID